MSTNKKRGQATFLDRLFFWKKVACPLFLLSTLLLNASFAEETRPIYTIAIDDYIVTPAVEEYIIKSIRTAEETAQCLVIYLDTPGGLLNSTRNIVKEIMNADVPIIVYVAPKGARAGSAGVFITLAANVATMAPSTNIGAAHPVQIKEKSSFSELIKEITRYFRGKREVKDKPPSTEEPGQQQILSKKIMSDTLAWVTAIAEDRRRNVAWAKKAVSESLSVTEKEALKLGVIDFVAEDTQDLLRQLDGRPIIIKDRTIALRTEGAVIQAIDMTLRQRLLNIISNPTIAYILMILGFYGLLFEFTHPGIGFPGIAGTISLILGFYGLHTLPTSYAGVALIILAIILFIAETQVTSFGLLTLGGITCMLLGSLILIDSPYEFMRISLKVILPFALATAGVTIFLTSAVVKTHRRRRLCGKDGLVGEKAEVFEGISEGPALKGVLRTGTWGTGKVFVHGEIWKAKSKDRIKKGEEVEIVGFDGMELIVKRRRG